MPPVEQLPLPDVMPSSPSWTARATELILDLLAINQQAGHPWTTSNDIAHYLAQFKPPQYTARVREIQSRILRRLVAMGAIETKVIPTAIPHVNMPLYRLHLAEERSPESGSSPPDILPPPSISAAQPSLFRWGRFLPWLKQAWLALLRAIRSPRSTLLPAQSASPPAARLRHRGSHPARAPKFKPGFYTITGVWRQAKHRRLFPKLKRPNGTFYLQVRRACPSAQQIGRKWFYPKAEIHHWLDHLASGVTRPVGPTAPTPSAALLLAPAGPSHPRPVQGDPPTPLRHQPSEILLGRSVGPSDSLHSAS